MGSAGGLSGTVIFLMASLGCLFYVAMFGSDTPHCAFAGVGIVIF
jgi:hypothetical protein